MAVQGPWVGSSAVAETGQRWMSNAAGPLRVGVPFWLSQFVGQSKELYISIGANDNYNKDELINWLRSIGNTPGIITVIGNIIGYNSGVPCLEFPGDLANAYIELRINPGVHVLGRGGQGGTQGHSNGFDGGTAINNGIGDRLRITNNGIIGGGGGGGGGVDLGTGRPHLGGGGGAPYGAGGVGTKSSGGGGSFNVGGPPGSNSNKPAGGGGGWGSPGRRGDSGGSLRPFPPGAAGRAVIGNSPIWRSVGTIYGDRV